MAERLCECPQWIEWANDPFLPLWYNPRMNEYVLVHGKLAADVTCIYYCLFCGGSMPKSRRGDFFEVPSEEDLADARTLLPHVTDATTMRSMLGEPDGIMDWWTDESDELIRDPDSVFKRQYRYRSRWRTLQVTIQEFEDGHLRIALSGRPKDLDTTGQPIDIERTVRH